MLSATTINYRIALHDHDMDDDDVGSDVDWAESGGLESDKFYIGHASKGWIGDEWPHSLALYIVHPAWWCLLLAQQCPLLM